MQTLITDIVLFRQANVIACSDADVPPLLALNKQEHHGLLMHRFAPAATGPLTQMGRQLSTQADLARYSLRKHTVAPVLGIISGDLLK